eukprot:TRINITY_DN110878_c0_g1_i1.p1 TRINITY_DN110878_c0_g1~~TRINITY_DN110878_c0_g1_i1.p1  ORF type:complete len:660 (+),score=67.88 TRINITY_DN110878_c0_g1_i1:80-2059(+)
MSQMSEGHTGPPCRKGSLPSLSFSEMVQARGASETLVKLGISRCDDLAALTHQLTEELERRPSKKRLANALSAGAPCAVPAAGCCAAFEPGNDLLTKEELVAAAQQAGMKNDVCCSVLLGISIKGIDETTKAVGFPLKGRPGVYVRDESKLSWVTERFGPQRKGVPGENLTNYDLRAAVDQWCNSCGNASAMSAAHAFFLQGARDKQDVPLVHLPNVYWSYSSSAGSHGYVRACLEMGWSMHKECLPPLPKCYWWFDVCCLPQGRCAILGLAEDTERVTAVVKAIRKVMVQVDVELSCLGRAWCHLEILSCFEAGGCVMAQTWCTKSSMNRALNTKPVKIHNMDIQAGTPVDYVRQRVEVSFGAERYNSLVSKELREGARAFQRYTEMKIPKGHHYLLGITFQGLVEFEEYIQFSASYVRDEEQLCWVTEEFGAQLTGYDFCAAIRAWLVETSNDHRSACEALQLEGEEWKSRVGEADVFYSHIQGVPLSQTFHCIGEGLAMYPTKVPSNAHLWLDFTTLRQCRSDFDLRAVSTIIEYIGCTLVEFDEDATYAQRSFCLFECFASVHCEIPLLCYAPPSVQERLESHPIDSEKAQTRSAIDKLAIDSYIAGSCGFKVVDATITAALKEALKLHRAESIRRSTAAEEASIAMQGLVDALV